MKFNKLVSYVKNPAKIVAYFISGKAKFVSDETYLKILYKAIFGRKLDLQNPQTFNEKLQWMKLYDRNPLYTQLVDKYAVREFVKERIGEQYLLENYGVWDRVDDIDFDSLPEQFVMKCTHNSGGVVICTDKKQLDIAKAKEKLERCLKGNYYYRSREWPYKNVPPRVIAERSLITSPTDNLLDYKFFCFDGKVEFLFIASDRHQGEVKFDYFDPDFNRMELRQGAHANSDYSFEKPEKFDEMLLLAEKLSKGFRQVRVDLYCVNGEIYFGEMTFFHHGGFVPFIPDTWDYVFGSKIKID